MAERRDEVLFRSGMVKVDPPPTDYERGLQDAWDAINEIITRGELPEPAHSERNGMILASNQVFCILWKRFAKEEDIERLKRRDWSD